MASDEDISLQMKKIDIKVLINLTLLGITFTIFTFIATANPDLFVKNIFTLQLVLSIPFFLTATLARSKVEHTVNSKKWNNFGFFTYITGYSLLVNSVGIILSSIISTNIALLFFIVNILLSIAYAIFSIRLDKDNVLEEAIKTVFFLALLVLLGILPAMGIF